MKPAISVRGLGKSYHIVHQTTRNYRTLRDDVTDWVKRLARGPWKQTDETGEDFWALRDVSFDVQPGEIMGVIGRNGAGKSTLLKILSRITPPTVGEVFMRGRVGSLLEVGTGFHPELSGRENIFLSGTILGMKRREVVAKFDAIVAFAEVDKFLDTPVKRYSSGMYVRLAFAVAAHLEPDILIVDEVLAVGDAQFQKKCMGKMQAVSEQEGRTVLFVSHNMQAIRQMCGRVIFLKQGQVAAVGDPHAAISAYLGQGAESESPETIDLLTYPRQREPEGARFRQLRFLDGQNRPVHRVTIKDVLGVEVAFTAQKRLSQFDMSMAVVHAEGLRVFSEVYSDQHPLPDLEPGEYILRFEIPMRFFKLESYFLSVTLVEGGRVCDSIDGLLMPEIINENLNLHTETNRWGVLRVPVAWDLVKPAPHPPQGQLKEQ